jgi:2-methylaconitate cis-trans-isomerase PrpF
VGDNGISIVSADVDRTARRIMGGLVYVRAAWGA